MSLALRLIGPDQVEPSQVKASVVAAIQNVALAQETANRAL